MIYLSKETEDKSNLFRGENAKPLTPALCESNCDTGLLAPFISYKEIIESS